MLMPKPVKLSVLLAPAVCVVPTWVAVATLKVLVGELYSV